ncbi:esterase [Pandoraea faecigallinarum]|uniref:Esterase n=1 Tax=Pandoraea faecigallinarum TaxID=656179 RepID=A0A0H3WSD7_9BURK|nr:alpha/beta hydrolase [Pandoraea faecigallinarum]AKM29493.1 esterase [Pandoraea faecigallinarum]
MKHYRNFDDAELDVQYNARATTPNVLDILKLYAEHSAQARAVVPCVLDVAYGDHPDETLDIFPAATPGAPVLFFVHGGYWRALNKSDSSNMAPAFTRAGATVVAINYSLAPGASLDTIVDQTRRALAWVHRHIGEHHGDARRIHVCGSSAGGHLVGMLLAKGWHAQYDVPQDVIAGAAPLSGLFDLTPIPFTHINAWMNLSADDARRNSPIFLLPERGCPLVVSYGETETAEFKRQTDDYLGAWREKGFPGEYVPMPGTNHFDIVLTLNDPASPLTQAIFRQMGLPRETP